MKCSFSLLLLVSLVSTSLSCAVRGTRSYAASFVPKLDLTWRLSRMRSAQPERAAERVDMGVAAWLRWQPTVYAAQVPERFELSPSAWIAPCEPDDSGCFDEFAQDEQELADALREAP